MGIVFGRTGTAEPTFTLLKQFNGFSVRQMPGYSIAEVKMASLEDKNAGFRVLAKYIGVFGNPENVGQTPMAMTSPVITEGSLGKPEALAMTSPVLTEGTTTAEDTMAFVLPFERSHDSFPKPTDERVHLKEVKGRVIAVKEFSGWFSKALGTKMYNELKSELEEANFSANAEYQVAQYHPPFTLPFLRRNEIWIPLAEEDEEVKKIMK